MKKFGFTLAEVLISLGIISVIATLTAPTLINAMPDKDKVMVIKLHNEISNITKDLLDNTSYYRDEECVTGSEKICAGLASTAVPFVDYTDTSKYSGNIKYPMLLSEFLHTKVAPDVTDEVVKFETIEGSSWTIKVDSARAVNTSTDEYEMKYAITVDIKPNSSNNCSAGTEGCKNPDQFVFLVDTHGSVTGKDELTKQYLKTSTKLNNKKDDYKAVGLKS